MFGNHYSDVLIKCGSHYGFDFDPRKKIRDFSEIERLVFYDGVDSEAFKALYPNIKKTKKVNDGYFKGVMTFMKEKAVENAKKKKKNSKITNAFVTYSCKDCNGSRLSYDGRTVTVNGKTIVEVSQLDMNELMQWIDKLVLTEAEKKITEAVTSDLKKKNKKCN